MSTSQSCPKTTSKALLLHRLAGTVAKHAGTEGVRFVLNGVQIQDRGDGKSRVSATDGRRAFILETTDPEPADQFPEIPGFDETANGASSVVVDAREFAAVMKKPMRRSPKRIFECAAVTLEDRKATFAATGLEAGTVETIRTMDGRYPEMDDILPRGKRFFSVGVNPKYLAELCKSLQEIIKGSGREFVRLDFYGDRRRAATGAFTLSAETANHKAVAVLMPFILEDDPS